MLPILPLPIMAVRNLSSTPPCLISAVGEKTCIGVDGLRASLSYVTFKSIDYMTSSKNTARSLVGTGSAVAASILSQAFTSRIEYESYSLVSLLEQIGITQFLFKSFDS